MDEFEDPRDVWFRRQPWCKVNIEPPIVVPAEAGFLKKSAEQLVRKTPSKIYEIEHLGRLMSIKEFRDRYCPKYRCLNSIRSKLNKGLSPVKIMAEQRLCKGKYIKLKTDEDKYGTESY